MNSNRKCRNEKVLFFSLVTNYKFIPFRVCIRVSMQFARDCRKRRPRCSRQWLLAAPAVIEFCRGVYYVVRTSCRRYQNRPISWNVFCASLPLSPLLHHYNHQCVCVSVSLCRWSSLNREYTVTRRSGVSSMACFSLFSTSYLLATTAYYPFER